ASPTRRSSDLRKQRETRQVSLRRLIAAFGKEVNHELDAMRIPRPRHFGRRHGTSRQPDALGRRLPYRRSEWQPDTAPAASGGSCLHGRAGAGPARVHRPRQMAGGSVPRSWQAAFRPGGIGATAPGNCRCPRRLYSGHAVPLPGGAASTRHLMEPAMELPNKDLGTLFEQLGMPSDPASIDAFIASHAPLPEHMKLAEAPFWNESQRTFFEQEWIEDADWAPIVDELNVRLHETPHTA